MSAQAVEVKNVGKSFGAVHALKDISLNIPEGEFFSLLGPSGCGKTTLLRMIAGLDQPSTGSIFIGGKDMANVPAHKRSVNTVFQSYALFPHLSVFENIAFGLKLGSKLTNDEIRKRVTESLELVRLPHLADRLPKQLSGGQQQRIAFARAIVNKPLVLLLDEPLSALDPRIREEMQAELARFKRELGITFVMVTHDQSEAFALSDTIAVFNAGHLEQLGPPREIYESPKSVFVADFVGHTNVLKGKVTQVGASVAVAVNDKLIIRGYPAKDTTLSSNDDAVLWVRTHAVSVQNRDQHAESGENTFCGTVVHVSYQGESSDIILDVHGQRITASLSQGQVRPQVGEAMTVALAPEHVHILK